jgi:hypothetical protein
MLNLPGLRPAATTPPPATISTHGHTLEIRDTEAGDTITVTDTGAGSVSVIVTYSTGGSVSGGGTGIQNVNIDATGGKDIVDYTYGATIALSGVTPAVKPALATSSNSYESIDINVGKGNNTVDFTDTTGLIGANLSLNVCATGGNNMVTESFGALTTSKLYSSFEGTGGSDTLNATLAGGLTTSHAYFSAFGGGGGNKLSLSVTGEIAADSLLNAQLSGGFKGGDTINFFYNGILDGKLFADTTGAGGNETITQTLDIATGTTMNPGSTGSLYSLIAAGRGSEINNLTLNLADDSGGSGTATSTLKAVHAAILDQTGDTVTQNVSTNDTSDVTVKTQNGHGWFGGWLGFGFWGW